GVTGGHRFGFSQGFIRLFFCFSSALLALFLFISPALGFMVAEFSAFIAFALQPQFSAGRIRITHRLPPVGGSVMPTRKVRCYVDAGCHWYQRTTRIFQCIARRRLARGTKQVFQRTHGRDSRWTRLPSLESPSARLHRLDRSLSVR